MSPTLEQCAFIAAALVAAAVVVRVLRSRGVGSTAATAVRALAAPIAPRPVERSSAQMFSEAMAAIERDGVKQAVEALVVRFAESHARDYQSRVQGIVAPKDPHPPPPL